MRLIGLLLILGGIAFAGEYVVFASGSRLRVEGHEAEGSRVRLRLAEGQIEVEASQVVGYEAEESAAEAATGEASGRAEALSPAQMADAAADKCGLPRQLVRSVMAAESGANPQAVSPKGAIGLMQLMPGTARTLGVNAQDPAQNAYAGACYLRDLLIRYDNRLWHALAAYNAGPQAVDKYSGIPPYAETIRYVNRITLDYLKKSKTEPQQ